VLLGQAGGSQLRWVSPAERAALWERVRRCYAGPTSGAGTRGSEVEYMGFEFTTADQRRLLYLEEWC
jgi:hypothetical protein